MNETLQEFVDSRGVQVRVEPQQGIIRGVKILGVESRNGRTYLDQALQGAVGLYENAKVNVNHPRDNPLGPRDYRDRIGVIRNVAARPGEGLFADFHFNPKHALAEQLAWDAEHAPQNLGFSHNVQARTARRGDRTVVEAILKVQSVDLVADPATTQGLFESMVGQHADQLAAATDAVIGEQERLALAEATVEDLRRRRPDLVEALLEEPAADLARLQAENERLLIAETLREKRSTINRLLGEFRIPDLDATRAAAKLVVDSRFVESLLAAKDERAMRQLVEQRARLARDLAGDVASGGRGSARPVCRDQSQVYAPSELDAKAFVRSIT